MVGARQGHMSPVGTSAVLVLPIRSDGVFTILCETVPFKPIARSRMLGRRGSQGWTIVGYDMCHSKKGGRASVVRYCKGIPSANTSKLYLKPYMSFSNDTRYG